MMETNLAHKYMSGRLSAEELRQLRELVRESSDEALGSIMEAEWTSGAIEDSEVSQERVDALFRKVQDRIHPPKSIGGFYKWAGMAAAILIPVCLAFSIYGIVSAHHQAAQTITVSTAKGEQSTILLPDGTTVKLNELSNLQYSPHEFGDKKRAVTFDGEAYFEVAKKRHGQFAIKADMVEVAVLGTVFNLSARPGNPFDKLILIEGEVRISVPSTGENAVLGPNDEAIVDKGTGKIIVTKSEDAEIATGWVRREITLKRTSLAELILILEDRYGVGIACGDGIDMEELFTGTLPADNLIACAEILEYAFDVDIKVLDGRVQITKR